MTLRDYLAVARRWWWLAALGIAAAGGAAGFITSQLSDVYTAEATLLVNRAAGTAGTSLDDILASQRLTETYAELAVSNVNLKRAAAELAIPGLDFEALDTKVSARAIRDTQLIKIRAKESDPALAALIANTVAGGFPAYVQEAQLAGRTGESRQLLNSVFVAEPAEIPRRPSSPNMTVNVLLGLLLGAVISVSGIALLEYLDDDVSGRERVEALGAPFLGAVLHARGPRRRRDRKKWVPSILKEEPSSALAEEYRQIQQGLSFALAPTGARVIVVTSAGAGEGKTTTAANVAQALSESNRRILLIDGDLRRPAVQRYFDVPNSSGLTSALLVNSRASRFLTGINDHLSVMTSGPLPPSPVPHIGSAKMASILGEFREEFDLIVIDSPPALGLADASAWLVHADGAVLVARPGKTRQGALVEAIRAVSATDKPLFGVILNAVRRGRRGRYGYGYGYTYGARQDAASGRARATRRE